MPKSSGRQRRGTINNTTTMNTRPGQADDGDAVKSIAVGDFVDVTNAEPEVARHVLEAHGWDVDEAVSFYLETGGVGYQQQTGEQAEEENGNQMEVDGRHQRSNGTRRSRGASHPIVIEEDGEEVVDLQDDDEDDIEEEEEEENDDDWEEDEDEQDEEENLRTLASLRSRRRSAADVNYQEDTDDDDDDMEIEDDAYGDEEERFKYGRRSRRGHRRSLRRVQQPSQPTATMDAQVPDDILRMPDVNVEEQKMLLAALTGQAYEGDLPTQFTPSSARPLSPGAIERRMLREEQDLALKESLERDKEKQRQQEIEKIRELEREESERLEKEAQERQLNETLETKKMRLPEEPQENQDGCFVLVIRMPNGSRLKRRFSKKDSIQSAFDFVDVEGGATDVLPGTYNLVSQFPRKVYGHTHQGTFEDSDFTHKQEALFVERVH
ncbi:Plant UBX domain-containing protein 13 [Picochlorum sp. SENEW3]|nr:Plant UBX domain-containing protein 13 [Picochlorum sp. SENEW3]WPT14734.1 Plant UBX domain-containing protein 13 [Picochlorum sp. SENEW3]